jgi:hypothetical protein
LNNFDHLLMIGQVQLIVLITNWAFNISNDIDTNLNNLYTTT